MVCSHNSHDVFECGYQFDLDVKGLNDTIANAPPRTLKVTVVQAFRPFTISPVLKVSFEGSASAQHSLAVLKLYDRRCMTNYRETYAPGRPYDTQKDRDYEEYLDAIRCTSKEPIDFDDPNFWPNNDLSPGEFEAYLEFVCQRFFRAEVRTYNRLAHLQGIKIP